MRFAFTPEQEELRSTVRGLLDRCGPPSARTPQEPVPESDPVIWRRLAEQIGVCGLAIPERYGGSGFSLLEAGIVVEELGRVLSPAPLLGSAVLAAECLLATGDDDACARLLPGIAAGELIASLAWAERDRGWSTEACGTTAVRRGGRWNLHGHKDYVLDGSRADAMLVVADTGAGLSLFELATEAISGCLVPSPTMDATRPLTRIELRGTPATLVGAEGAATGALERARDVAAAAVAAEQYGAAERWLGETVEYTKLRTQFNRPIGSFQAIKHRLADRYVDVESARSVSAAALWAVATRAEEAPRWSAMAKSWCGDTYATVAAEAIQLHGGIGITWEHEAHLHLKRAHSSNQLFGTADHHRTRLATSLTGRD